ncbi:phytoene/squalene synthase family protein [Nocardia sp. 348MFTsu5.1]|uniref:phytoene/squalene synthase family protein n=1 Tax=Nocardia sp. 348MFTsu5.1 TaxID=1172185 RepID=UPI0003703212|nr:phytoene/squalene synthase family protein [Nocardia sp. 348MFTsu5.1]
MTDALGSAYEHCRQLTKVHGRTYYAGTQLLSKNQRNGVYALYGFARMIDDIVDIEEGPDRLTHLDAIEADLAAALADPAYRSELPEVLAVADTAAAFSIDHRYFEMFMRSMRMDLPESPLHVSRYRTMEQLREYMYGSAGVIGLQMLPILGTVVPISEAVEPARALGDAFQLTNFIRDLGEDLDRDRIYLPTDELAAFGVEESMLRRCRRTGQVPPELRRALAHLIAVTRAEYRLAEPGIDHLTPASRPGIRAAFTMYRAILDEVEANGYRVLTQRVRVPQPKRLAHVAAALAPWR